MSTEERAPSWDVYWPRAFVGRTLSAHPLEVRDGTLWCRTCAVQVESSGLHLMEALRAQPAPPKWVPPNPPQDRRESSIDWPTDAA